MSDTEYFGMKKAPFTNELATKELISLPGMLQIKQRMDYVLKNGGVMVMTGDVGVGKTTALRWGLEQYHKSEIHYIYVTATSGSTNELYRQICWGLNLNVNATGRVRPLKEIREAIAEHVKQKKGKLVVVLDEASLLRTEVFSELHLLTQFNLDSANLFSLILAGQNSLIDKLSARSSEPLASRVITKGHLPSLSREQMGGYLQHHVKLTGVKANLFTENAVTAIHQGSGGLLRRANALARGALYACMIEKENHVTEEHVRIASTELL